MPHRMQASCILAIVLAVALRNTSANTIVLDRSLLDAMREVESSGNVCAIGDNGLSLGPYQIMMGYYSDASDPNLGDPTLTDNGMIIYVVLHAHKLRNFSTCHVCTYIIAYMYTMSRVRLSAIYGARLQTNVVFLYPL